MLDSLRLQGEQLAAFLPVLGVLLLFAATARAVRGILARWAGAESEERRAALRLLDQALYTGLLAIGVVTALGTLGINVSALVAGLGLTGFALGIALKDGLSNVVSGAMLLIYRPFRIGDRITVAGNEGIVTSIDLRYTTLSAPEQRILIPNSTLFTNSVIVHREAEADSDPPA